MKGCSFNDLMKKTCLSHVSIIKLISHHKDIYIVKLIFADYCVLLLFWDIVIIYILVDFAKMF